MKACVRVRRAPSAKTHGICLIIQTCKNDSNPENISDSAILRVTLSDHCAVHCIRKLMGSCKRQRRTITSKEMKNFDISQINSKQLVDLSDNVSTAVNNFTYLLSTFIEKHPPLRTICVSDKVTPWLTREYKKLSRSGDKRKTAAVEHKSSILISCYRQMRIKEIAASVSQQFAGLTFASSGVYYHV